MTADFILFFVTLIKKQKMNNGMNWTFTDKHCQPGQQTAYIGSPNSKKMTFFDPCPLQLML